MSIWIASPHWDGHISSLVPVHDPWRILSNRSCSEAQQRTPMNAHSTYCVRWIIYTYCDRSASIRLSVSSVSNQLLIQLFSPWTKWAPVRFFDNEKFCILVEILLKFVTKGSVDNNQTLVQIMTQCRIGDKPLSEAMLTWFTDAYMRP